MIMNMILMRNTRVNFSSNSIVFPLDFDTIRILYFFTLLSSMTHEIILHISDLKNERSFIQDEVQKNLSGKLDAYLKKIAAPDDVIRVELTLIKSKRGTSGKLHVSIPWHSYMSEREDFEKLEDLINHLFTHIKDQFDK